MVGCFGSFIIAVNTVATVSSSFKWLIKSEAAKVCLFECKSFYPKTWFLCQTFIYNPYNFGLCNSVVYCNFYKHLHSPVSENQVTLTWCTASFANATSFTSWLTCLQMSARSRKPCRGKEGATAPIMPSSWRPTTPATLPVVKHHIKPHQFKQALWMPAWRPCHVCNPLQHTGLTIKSTVATVVVSINIFMQILGYGIKKSWM